MEMKRALCLTAMWLPTMAWAQQVIVVDDVHMQMGPGTPPAYKIKPATSVVLDARNYTFQVPLALKGKPINSVQIVVSKQQYSANWNPVAGRLTLSSATLKSSNNGTAFAGFSSHQQAVVAVGNLTGRNFGVVWVGLVDVD